MASAVPCFSCPKKRIKKTGLADIVAEFAMFEEDVHRFPKRVIENFDHLLMHEWVGSCALEWRRNRRVPGRAKVIALRARADFKRGRDFRIAFRRAESHDDVVG